MHGGLVAAGPFGSATLSIEAWDVDYPTAYSSQSVPEEDMIQGMKGGIWTDIDLLSGLSNTWVSTIFTLDSSWKADIETGLKLQILIDQQNTNFYGVSLKQSTLTLNPIPIPAAVWLFGTALFGIAGISRRRKRS